MDHKCISVSVQGQCVSLVYQYGVSGQCIILFIFINSFKCVLFKFIWVLVLTEGT